MSTIQIILIFTIIFLGIWIYLKDFLPWIKVSGYILIAVGGYFVILPEHSNKLANYVNVGRGADLLLYFFIIASCFYVLSSYQKIKNIERATTLLFREKAKSEAIFLGKNKKNTLL